MNGDASANVLTGTAADEIIRGLEGNDTLSGGPGNDTLVGGIGFDTFVVNPGDEAIEIQDFTLFSDRLDLSAFDRSTVAQSVLLAQGTDAVVLTLSDGIQLTVRGEGLSLSNFDLMDIRVSGQNQAPQGTLDISGETAVGQELSVDTSQIIDQDGIREDTVKLTWFRDGVAIANSNVSTYLVTSDDIGAEISVQYSYRDVFGEFETVSSEVSSASDDNDQADPQEPVEGPEVPDNGAGVNDTVSKATPFNDVFTARAGMSEIDGRGGVDLVFFAGDQSNYTLTLGPSGVSVLDKRPDGLGEISLQSIERIDFETQLSTDDSPLDLTQIGSHTQLSEAELEALIEMYIAYFDRAPDAIGLGFWGSAFATGTSMEEIADLFADQPETQQLYPQDMVNVLFVAGVYENVLGRAPDFEGLQFWRGALDSGTVGRGDFILEILRGVHAEAPENASQYFLDRKAADKAYLEAKTDLGAYYAVHCGMSDVEDAAMIMGMFDGSIASLSAATDAVNALHQAAQNPETGDFLMPLVGVLDDPFTA